MNQKDEQLEMTIGRIVPISEYSTLNPTNLGIGNTIANIHQIKERPWEGVNAQLLNALELLLARYFEVAPDPESDGEVQLARAVIAAAKEVGHE